MLMHELEFLVIEMLGAVCGHNLNNPKHLDIIYSIFRKFNIKIQEYLVDTEYWISQMTAEEKQQYGILT